MTPQDIPTGTRRKRWLGKAFWLAALGGIAALALQGCATDEMPQPKYPIYMQNKPAEATQTPAQAEEPPAIKGPASSGSVTTSDLTPPPPPPPPEPSTSASSSSSSETASAPVKDTRAAYVYILQAHDTLYGVSRRFGVPVKTLYEINGLAPDSGLRIGQKILLPDTAVDKGAEEHANGPGMVKLNAALPPAKSTTPAPAKPATPAPAKPATSATKPTTTTTTTTTTKPTVSSPATTTTTTTVTKPVETPPAPPAATGFPSNTQIAQMGKGLFVWPVKGKILVPFGQLAPNVRNDGINIAADAGTDVKASADGVVVYEGDQVKELGNTIYIKHPNGWYTGYSHLLSMTVKNNEHVTKGQVIAKVGQTGVIDRPQLHFEVRYTPSTDIAKPIDPNLVLPQ
ncbi:MAG TPA: M23 family metallopeptidase [Asticcacaulis sp.]|nr:M23 family metallopeptidase [Asticcacaulis sp.]